MLFRHCPDLTLDFIDGEVSPALEAAVRRFQQAYGLDVTGKLGPDTTEALGGAPTGQCGTQVEGGH